MTGKLQVLVKLVMSSNSAAATIEIREATLAERPIVADVTRLSYREYEKDSDPTFWRNYEINTRKTLLEDIDCDRLIALVDGKIAGAVLFCQPYEWNVAGKVVKNVFPEFRLLAVLPEYRNYKIGARLIDECENRAKNLGFSAITLHTTILMQTAKAMYERRGYQPYPTIDFEPVPGFTVWGYKKDFSA